MVNTIAQALGLSFNIEFTPDLMPSDIVGSEISTNRGNSIREGPLFANIVLADGSADASQNAGRPPEAMQRPVTAAGQRLPGLLR